MAIWENKNIISTVSRDNNGIKSTVQAPNIYSEAEDAMLYKLYLYVLKNTEQADEGYHWGEGFDSFVSTFKGYFIRHSVT